MLRLLDIKKNYVMKYQEPVRALRGVSVNFRRNEFVAILGPSGCGKTTLLNIIGGLDRYSEGDLVIKDKSTKNYSDRDWDTYRNHSVGFVFQAYNLIGHQTVSKNVELALTIAGISRKERKERAYAALEKVGLKGMEKKRPNQLSGGQMQRVAIARALVNNPEILLADEPTGALDSETSVQIMDLLKEVAQDRLVIMVTHNPDLAEKYATRIVNMFDGVITGDTNPYSEKEEKKESYDEVEEVVNKGNKKKSSMSFLTATSLSLANLFSKSKRTILVAVAGSIGIFGVSTVLAASTGVNMYIDGMQDDMLSSYPLTIAEESVDYSSLMTGLYSDTDSKIADFDTTTEVGLNSMIDYLMNKYQDVMSVKTNTINDNLVKFINEIPEEYVSAISYSYGIDPTNNIFTTWSPNEGDPEIKISLNGLTQRYIAQLQTVKGFERYASYVDLFTDFMLLMPGEQDYILSQYDLLGDSHFPENENEIMLVVEGDTTLTDLVFAQMGYYHEEELMNIAKTAIVKYDPEGKYLAEGETVEEFFASHPYRSSFSFDQLINKELTYYPHDTIYRYGDISTRDYTKYSMSLRADTDSDGTDDEFYVFKQNSAFDAYTKGTSMDGVPIFQVTHLKTSPASFDTYYAFNVTKDATKPVYGTFYLVKQDSIGVLMDLFSGEIDMTSAMSDPRVIALITSGDLTRIIVPEGGVTAQVGLLSSQEMSVTVTEEEATDKVRGYNYPAVAEDSWGEGTRIKIAGILRPKKGVSFGCLRRGVYYTKEFQAKYMQDAKNSQIINDANNGFKTFLEKEEAVSSSLYNAYVTFEYPDFTDPDHPVISTSYASCLNGDLNSSFSTLFSKITGVDYAGENETHFRSLCGLKQVVTAYDENERPAAYEYKELPEKMSIYPVNFKYKDKVTNYLDQWNKKGDITFNDGTTLAFEDRDELTYTDTISLIIGVIDTMITIVTTALVIFTSLSLVVSSFMIMVITYISVMERVKEIGVIRSLGGRKRDVSRLFIAENLVTGTLSGIIGLVITGIVCLIINAVVSPFGVPNIAVLTPLIILIMMGLSIGLSVLAGLIPSMHASRQDPVIALRSE